jgi:hypothetical protein
VNDAIPNPARIPTAERWAFSLVCAVLERRYGYITLARYRLRLGQLEDQAARAEHSGWAVPRVPTWQGPNR